MHWTALLFVGLASRLPTVRLRLVRSARNWVRLLLWRREWAWHQPQRSSVGTQRRRWLMLAQQDCAAASLSDKLEYPAEVPDGCAPNGRTPTRTPRAFSGVSARPATLA